MNTFVHAECVNSFELKTGLIENGIREDCFEGTNVRMLLATIQNVCPETIIVLCNGNTLRVPCLYVYPTQSEFTMKVAAGIMLTFHYTYTHTHTQ